jgi:protein-tyrosine phosphatase
VIDLHCHVLPGVDDGPETVEESLALVAAAQATGAERLVATPHVSSQFYNESATITRAVSELNARLAVTPASAAIEVLSGAEIALARVPELDPDELRRLGLGGGSWLLLEPPASVFAPGMAATIDDLQARGHRVVLAHPERCPIFHRDPPLLQALVDEGALTSITAGSLVGRFGGVVRRFALALFEANLVHNVASDFHSIVRRPPGAVGELEQAGLGELADWLTHDVPAAILESREIPRRPAVTVAMAPSKNRWRKWRRQP